MPAIVTEAIKMRSGYSPFPEVRCEALQEAIRRAYSSMTGTVYARTHEEGKATVSGEIGVEDACGLCDIKVSAALNIPPDKPASWGDKEINPDNFQWTFNPVLCELEE